MGFERSSECAWFQNRIAGARDRGIPIPTPARTKRAPGTPGLRGAHSCDKRFWASTEWGDSRAGPACDTGFETRRLVGQREHEHRACAGAGNVLFAVDG